jgi:O-methyltransferase domain
LFELEHVIRRTRESLKAYGVGDRCSLIEGNFFESLPCGADTYLFRQIIHDWSDLTKAFAMPGRFRETLKRRKNKQAKRKTKPKATVHLVEAWPTIPPFNGWLF